MCVYRWSRAYTVVIGTRRNPKTVKIPRRGNGVKKIEKCISRHEHYQNVKLHSRLRIVLYYSKRMHIADSIRTSEIILDTSPRILNQF